MKLQFWGVRGYVPTPGSEYVRYGGNTCCTLVEGDNGELIVLDTGTGFCQLGDTLMAGPLGRGQGRIVLLISHPHWDHILGLPFPAVVHLPGNQFTIYGPDSTRGPLELVYDGLLSPVYSPVYGLAHMGATHRFHTITGEPFQVGRLTISAWPFVHGDTNSPIWAYRIEEGQRSLVYITDVCYNDDSLRHQAIDFAHKADVLIHSAPYLCEEDVRDYGHSRVEEAIEVSLRAGVRRLFLFHHAPTRADSQIDTILDRFRAELSAGKHSLRLDAAAEGPIHQV